MINRGVAVFGKQSLFQCLYLAIVCLILGTPPAIAQPTPPSVPASPGGQAGQDANQGKPSSGPGGPVIQQKTSGLYLEWTITSIVVGVGVYAVCRSSRRN